MTESNAAYEDILRAKKVVLALLERETVGAAVGIVLGSGLGLLTEQLVDPVRIPYGKIPGMPSARVAGHQGELIFGGLDGTMVVCLSGRAHLYEGHHPSRVVFGVRLLAALGVQAVIMSNAAGGISMEATPGKLLLITDHLNLTGQSPLTGSNENRWGPRFVDMSAAYHRGLGELTRKIARRENIPLAEGTYAGLLGPTYETPAEIRMLEAMGASAVGMSTVHEVIALRHQGVPVVGLSCVTNFAAGKSSKTLNHEDVSKVAKEAGASFCRLVACLCENIPAELRGDDPRICLGR